MGFPRHQNVNNAGYGFWCPDWLAIFWRACIHFSLVRTADFRISRVQNQGRAAFYFSTEFLGCAECEYFADAVSNCNFALRVATKLA